MSRASIALLIVATLCVASVSAVDLPPLCSGTEDKCKAKAKLTLFVRGPGRCEGKALAKCTAIAAATEPCLDIQAVNFRSDKCFPIDVTRVAKCFTAAIAAVFTKAAANVACEGKKAVGCAWSKAEGDAFACSYALALVQLVIKIGGHDAACEANVGALAEVFARAASKSAADVCVKNASASAFDSDFAIAIDTAVAKAIASCWLYCDGSNAIAVVDGEAEVVQKSGVITKGDGASGSVGDGH